MVAQTSKTGTSKSACVTTYMYLRLGHTSVFTSVNLFGLDGFQHFYSCYSALFFGLVSVENKGIN